MKIDDSYAWSTSKPLLASLIEITSPTFILELGMGLHSTPIFLNSDCNNIIFVDSDEEWIEHVRDNNLFDSRHRVLFHDLGPTKGRKLFPKQLTQKKRLEIIRYYKNLSAEIPDTSPKLLFVDNMTCCRTIAINTLYTHFDMIAYHDCEPRAIRWYEYYFEKGLKEFKHYVLKTPTSWTGCFMTLDVETDLFNNIEKHILLYSNEVGINPSKIYLDKEYTFGKSAKESASVLG